MKAADVIRVMETLAPPALAAEGDNVGLLVGDRSATVGKVMVCVDLSDAVLAEAVGQKAKMVIAHHPPIFKGLLRLTPEDGSVVYSAARSGVAIYAAHTNLDAAPGGTADVLADILGLENRRAVEPIAQAGEYKIVTFAPPEDLSAVADAAFTAGAGRIGNYYDCAFFGHGVGSFCGGRGTHPAVGHAGRHEVTEELRLEVICPRGKAAAVCEAIRDAHSYEQPAIDIYPLDSFPPGAGWGRLGKLPRPATVGALIGRLKKATGLRKVVLAAVHGRGEGGGRGALVTTAACCPGSAGQAYRQAAALGATLYVTGEMGHHNALEAVRLGLTVVCLGHNSSERPAMVRLAERLTDELRGLTVVVSQKDRDPFGIA